MTISKPAEYHALISAELFIQTMKLALQIPQKAFCAIQSTMHIAGLGLKPKTNAMQTAMKMAMAAA
jgi:hypothetical protein